ncbi:hypothetical protein HMPREF0322_02580 [Desulfitobacterium hafniense DP7]|uniref:Uncharacterized protein n=1 Tax=Desulfitobacterium hafniense DP7 TaxID=537010 RepID=G9XNN7_DESHA|nr:hypothetical protein HMPREF0322_02580 [Desulfitobacterium hafniense DP7]
MQKALQILIGDIKLGSIVVKQGRIVKCQFMHQFKGRFLQASEKVAQKAGECYARLKRVKLK